MTMDSFIKVCYKSGILFNILHRGLKAIIKYKEHCEEMDHSVFGDVFRRFVVNMKKVTEV